MLFLIEKVLFEKRFDNSIVIIDYNNLQKQSFIKIKIKVTVLELMKNVL
jgi:hypothetical protein